MPPDNAESEVRSPRGEAPRIAIVDDDALFRESLGLNLVENGYAVDEFEDGAVALKHFLAGGSASAILLDWRMPNLDGPGLLRRLRESGIQAPVIFLTVLGEDTYEEAALRGGAVDFIDKSRSLPIILQRLRLIAEGSKRAAGLDGSPESPTAIARGKLELRMDTRRALYGGRMVDLTLTEFNIVRLLASVHDTDVSYRQIYDLVRGKDFVAGFGEEGYRVNVRSFIKRIRHKFREIDEQFDCIANYPGFGYRWLDPA